MQRSHRVGWKSILSGGLTACWLAWAHADPTVHSANLTPGPLATMPAPNLEFDDSYLPGVAADMNETVVRIPIQADRALTLETTLFKPNGAGPFPLAIFNHGKPEGDVRTQPRSRPLAFAREFVRRGYVVAVPNREGFANSSGTYRQYGCDVERNGLAQADDVAATIAYMSRLPYVDATRIVVAGTSHGGLATIAYGGEAVRGVRGLINFSGGLRQNLCPNWQDNLIGAFRSYGKHTRVPSLWLYGHNDSIWTPELTARMYRAYAGYGAPARMINFGVYKNDAHRLATERDGARIWWSPVAAFLAYVDMPTRIQYHVAMPVEPPASGYAAVDAVSAVPFLDAVGRAGYRTFLAKYPSRAFAIAPDGAWSWAEGGEDPAAVALKNCQHESSATCQLYAINSAVVWQNDRQVLTAAGQAQDDTHNAAAQANTQARDPRTLVNRN